MSRRDNKVMSRRDIGATVMSRRDNTDDEEHTMERLTADDRGAITETLSLMGHIFDAGELDRLDEVFTADAVYDLTDAGVGAFEGVEAIRRGALHLGAGNPVAHHLTNVVITGGGGEVSVRSKGLILMTDGTVGSVVQNDTVRRRDGAWRVTRRAITPQRTPMSGKYPAAGHAML